METPIIIGAFALLMLTISLLQPLARRLGVAPSVLLAMVGTLIGIGATYLLYTPRTDAFNSIANVFVHPPLDSEKFLYVFLPLLLFQTSLTLDVRRLFEDWAPILVMAVVAVFVATAFIGAALYPLAGVPLVACLLLGAIVATTDPVAVVAIFRDIGAPARLGRIVEGESLLNDAAAIALFVLLLGILTGQQSLTASEVATAFARSFAGGIVVGAVLARFAVSLLPLMRDLPLAQVTLSLALPYGIYVVSDQFAAVSAVVAVVSAGVVFNLYGPSRIQPANWQFLHSVWDQISFWAASLIFLLAAILIPRLVAGFTPIDILLLLIVIVAALIARAVVIYGLLPVLSFMRAGEAVNNKYKTVMLWGGMRGAVTLTLALSVTEHAGLPVEISAFVTKLATGFVLFTLLVYGSSLKQLIKLLGLDQLNARDEALRNQYLALSLSEIRQEVSEAAKAYHVAPRVAEKVLQDYEDRAAAAAAGTDKLEELTDRDRVNIGLIALADREQQLVLEHFHDKTISGRSVSQFLAITGRTSDLARLEGRSGYRRASRQPLKFGLGFRFAQMLQRRFKITAPLSARLADRFEFLLVYRILADELMDFTDRRIQPLLGGRVADILKETLANRQAETLQAIDALRLQYPDYADALENKFLRMAGIRREETAYDEARDHMLIGTELHRDLLKEVEQVRKVCTTRPKLDLGMKTRELVQAHPLFEGLPRKQQKAVMKMMRPQFATPGETLIRRGERGDAAYFIASGAVEVSTPSTKARLGRGDVFGEIALMTGGRRSADVVAIGYCHLLSLKAQDFRVLMDKYVDLKQHVEKLSAHRLKMNAERPEPEAEAEDPVVPQFKAKTAGAQEGHSEASAKEPEAETRESDIGAAEAADNLPSDGPSEARNAPDEDEPDTGSISKPRDGTGDLASGTPPLETGQDAVSSVSGEPAAQHETPSSSGTAPPGAERKQPA